MVLNDDVLLTMITIINHCCSWPHSAVTCDVANSHQVFFGSCL